MNSSQADHDSSQEAGLETGSAIDAVQQNNDSSEPAIDIPTHLDETKMKHRLLSFKPPLSEVSCGFVKLTSNASRTFLAHENYYGLLLILRGEGKLTTKNNQHYDLRPGHVIQVYRHSGHVLKSQTKNWLEASLSIDHELIERFMSINGLDINQAVLNPKVSNALIHQFESIYNALMLTSRTQLPSVAIRIQQLILQIHHLSQASPTQGGVHRQLEQACILLEDSRHFLDSIDDIAMQLGMDTRQLRYLFKKHLKESPGQFRLKHKMAAAVAMLAQKQYTVAQIAQELGYSDPFTFSRQFKIYYGQAPTQYPVD